MSTSYDLREALRDIIHDGADAVPFSVDDTPQTIFDEIVRLLRKVKHHTCMACGDWRQACTCDGRGD